jgi:competence protein ComEA
MMPMRKPNISILLAITILFGVFTLGFFLGRNQNKGEISVSVSADFVEEPTMESVTVPKTSAEAVEISFPISINQAGKEELMALPGIGEVLATRIITFRDEHGAFSSVEELLNVEGVGKKRLEEIIDLITVGG